MEKRKVSIRRASLHDNHLLAALGAQTFYDAFAAENTPENMAAYLAASFNPEKQAAELADPLSTFLIAEVENEAVGYTSLKEVTPPPGVTGPKPVEIERVYARTDWIGYGIGSALMSACIEEAGNQGFETVWLGVWEYNQRALAFYKKWGFVQAGTQVFRLGDDLQTDLVLQRPVHLPEDKTKRHL